MYVSVTGFVPKNFIQIPRFWWNTMRCLAQAKRSPGNLSVTAKLIAGVYHTMTVWTDEKSMRAYVKTGAHRKTMSNFRTMGSGRTYGSSTDRLIAWDEAYDLWCRFAKEI